MARSKRKKLKRLKPVVLRVPEQLLARMEAQFERLKTTSPEGVDVSMSDAYRLVLAKGLAQLEKEAPPA